MLFIVPRTKAEKKYPFESPYELKDEAVIDNINLELINSKTYRKLYPFLIAGFLISYFVSFVFLFPVIVIIILTAGKYTYS